jgi:Mg-chelatase subunit ChlD
VLSQVTPETEVALIVFYTCGDIRVEHPFTTDAASVLAQVEAITPSGSTPLAAAITFAREYINANARGAARLVVLSDGMETCGGDPVAAARQ